MDEIKKYKRILRQILEEQASIPISNAPLLAAHLIINKDQSEFILLQVGWFGKEFRHGVIFHF